MKLQEHLLSLGACMSAREWSGERTAIEAWTEATRPDWLIWWRLKAHPEDRYLMVRLIVALIREHTLPLVRSCDRDACERALRAAEICCNAPTPENRKAASDAASASDAAAAAEREKIRAIWCAAIRARWPEAPWKEGQ